MNRFVGPAERGFKAARMVLMKSQAAPRELLRSAISPIARRQARMRANFLSNAASISGAIVPYPRNPGVRISSISVRVSETDAAIPRARETLQRGQSLIHFARGAFLPAAVLPASAARPLVWERRPLRVGANPH